MGTCQLIAGMHKNEMSKESWEHPGSGLGGSLLGGSQAPFHSQKVSSMTPCMFLRALLGTVAI